MNIGGDPHDTNYRYKRQPLEIKQLCRKNHQTQLVNLKGLASDLKVSPQDVMTHMKKRLGAQVVAFDTIQGQWTKQQLEAVVEHFIVHHVLCKNCKLPELSVDKLCSACGHNNDKTKETKRKIKNDKVGNLLLDLSKPLHPEMDKEIARVIKHLRKLEPSDGTEKLIDECWKIEDPETWSQFKLKHNF